MSGDVTLMKLDPGMLHACEAIQRALAVDPGLQVAISRRIEVSDTPELDATQQVYHILAVMGFAVFAAVYEERTIIGREVEVDVSEKSHAP